MPFLFDFCSPKLGNPVNYLQSKVPSYVVLFRKGSEMTNVTQSPIIDKMLNVIEGIDLPQFGENEENCSHVPPDSDVNNRLRDTLSLPTENFTSLLKCFYSEITKDALYEVATPEPPPAPIQNLTTISLHVDDFKFAVVGVMLTIISVFGLAGNVVAIIVLSRPAMKGSFSSLLISKSTISYLQPWAA